MHLSRELVTIDCEVPIEFHIEDLIRVDFNLETLSKDFQDLEMYSMVTQAKALSKNNVVVIDQSEKKYSTDNYS